MKKINALLVVAILLFALTQPASAAPRDFVFNIPVNVDFTGVTLSGKPVTQWQLYCQVTERTIGFKRLAEGYSFVFTGPALKMNLTTKITAKPTADWLANPSLKPESWACMIGDGNKPFSLFHSNETGGVKNLEGIVIDSTVLLHSGDFVP